MASQAVVVMFSGVGVAAPSVLGPSECSPYPWLGALLSWHHCGYTGDLHGVGAGGFVATSGL